LFHEYILSSPRNLGYVIDKDKLRQIKMRKDIYELAYTLCLEQNELEEMTKDEEGNV